MDVKEIAEKWIQADKQAFREGNFDALEQIYAPDIIIHSAPNPDMIGFEVNKEHILKVRKNISDLQQEWNYITGDGNVFAIAFKETFMPKVDIPIAPAGSNVNIDSLFVLRCENDKIAEIWMKGNTTLS